MSPLWLSKQDRAPLQRGPCLLPSLPVSYSEDWLTFGSGIKITSFVCLEWDYTVWLWAVPQSLAGGAVWGDCGLVRKWTLKRGGSRCLVRGPEVWILGWVLCCLCLLIAKIWATLAGSQGCSCHVFPPTRGCILKPWARRNLSSPKSLFDKDMVRTTGNVGLWDSSSQGLPSSTGHLVTLFVIKSVLLI